MKNVLIKAVNNIFPIDLTAFQLLEQEKSNNLSFLGDSIIAIPGFPTPFRPIYQWMRKVAGTTLEQVRS
jgi:hypothetical protein